MNTCKREGCSNPAKKSYCSAACRAQAWRDRNIPRCPRCDAPLAINVMTNPPILMTLPQTRFGRITDEQTRLNAQ